MTCILPSEEKLDSIQFPLNIASTLKISLKKRTSEKSQFFAEEKDAHAIGFKVLETVLFMRLGSVLFAVFTFLL